MTIPTILRLCVFSFLAFTLLTYPVHAEPVAPYVFSNAVLRATPAKIAAAYVTIDNPTALPDQLLGAKADWAGKIELHLTATDSEGVMTMAAVKNIALPAHGKIELKQGETHLMIFGVKQNLVVDQKLDVTMIFKNAGTMIVPFTVQPLGNAAGNKAGNAVGNTADNAAAVDHSTMHHMPMQ